MNDPLDLSALDEFEGDLPVRALLRTLADPLARYTVYYLREEPSVSLDRLAEIIVGWVNANTGSVAGPSDRDRTRILLYHVHLPMLDSLGVVEFDHGNRTVTMEDPSSTMESLIEWVRQLDQADGVGDFR